MSSLSERFCLKAAKTATNTPTPNPKKKIPTACIQNNGPEFVHHSKFSAFFSKLEQA